MKASPVTGIEIVLYTLMGVIGTRATGAAGALLPYPWNMIVTGIFGGSGLACEANKRKEKTDMEEESNPRKEQT